jgi:ZIP family zinc transporter
MRAAARSNRYILLLWTSIALGVALATGAGRSAFGLVGPSAPPHLQAFGAGALLAMTAETMIPEAFHNSPRFSGFLAAFGFCVVLLLGAVTH